MGSDDIGSLKGYNIRIEGLEITDDLPVINDRNRISQSAHGYDLDSGRPEGMPGDARNMRLSCTHGDNRRSYAGDQCNRQVEG